MDDLKKIGTLINNLRKDKKLSQEDLAGLTNFDRTYISKLENGKLNIGILHFIKIAREIGEEPGALLTKALKLNHNCK